jgi:hypothetical protein
MEKFGAYSTLPPCCLHLLRNRLALSVPACGADDEGRAGVQGEFDMRGHGVRV